MSGRACSCSRPGAPRPAISCMFSWLAAAKLRNLNFNGPAGAAAAAGPGPARALCTVAGQMAFSSCHFQWDYPGHWPQALQARCRPTAGPLSDQAASPPADSAAESRSASPAPGYGNAGHGCHWQWGLTRRGA